MHPNAERVQAQLKARGAAGEVVELAASTRTSQEAAAAIGTTVAQTAKSLVFLAGEAPVLASMLNSSTLTARPYRPMTASTGMSPSPLAPANPLLHNHCDSIL